MEGGHLSHNLYHAVVSEFGCLRLLGTQVLLVKTRGGGEGGDEIMIPNTSQEEALGPPF